MRPHSPLVAAFRERFGVRPGAVIHAPGRVNLVGDHIDYLLLPVLPMALDRGFTAVVRARTDAEVRLANVDTTFAARSFIASGAIAPAAGCWSNYARAGVQAVAGLLPKREMRGFDMLVASDLPVASGLSSSSALVVAAALAAVHANGLPLERLALAEAVAHGERYVGTEGGGMDQAASLCGSAGCALRIDFAPLRVQPIPVPAGWRILVVPSLRESRKSEEVRAAYNERSRSARTALAAATPLTGNALLGWLVREHERGAFAAADPRLRHVASEAARVVSATRALEQGDAHAFGALMSASHASLRDDYRVSTRELDEIVRIALEAGALGARLTGAGFGGCAIALATADTLEGVRRALHDHFYSPRAEPDHSFEAVPASPASISPL